MTTQDEKTGIQTRRIYLRDLSFEAPRSHETHQEKWQPEVNVNVQPSHSQLAQNRYEVKLHCTITCRNTKKIIYVIEIEQAGEFVIHGYSQKQTQTIVNTFCPNMLFPYVREAVDNLLVRGGYPALMLMPIQFEQLYAQSEKAKETNSANQTQKNVHNITTH